MGTGRRRHTLTLLKSPPICSVNRVVGDHGHHMSNSEDSIQNVASVAFLKAAPELQTRGGAVPAPVTPGGGQSGFF